MAKLSVALMFLMVHFSASAQEAELAGRVYDEAKEAEIAKRAHNRLYPGGKDESDLKVQTQLTNPVRKMAPSVNVTAEPEPSAED